jgi:hypothetical protein
MSGGHLGVIWIFYSILFVQRSYSDKLLEKLIKNKPCNLRKEKISGCFF